MSGELERIAAEAAQALQVERGADRARRAGRRARQRSRVASRSRSGAAASGRSTSSARGRAARGRARRLLPALASLLGVAIDRERLAREAVEAEALRRSDAMKTAVLRAVSHDLRSPLMAILTSAGALARGELARPRRTGATSLETILGEAERLDRLVSNLLDLSRLQAGAAAPEPEVWAVEDLVLQALDGVEAAGDRVEVSLPEEESPMVRVDAAPG